MSRKSMARRTFSRGWIDAVHCGKERLSSAGDDLDRFLETERPEEEVAEVDKETFQERLRLAHTQEEARWRLNNPVGRAAARGQVYTRYKEITKRTDTWQRLGRRQPFRVPDGLLGRFGSAGAAEDEVLSTGTNSTLGSATPTPIRPMSASSNRPLSARSTGSSGRPGSASRSRALVFRRSTATGTPHSSSASCGGESSGWPGEFGEAKTASSARSGEKPKGGGDFFKRRTTTRVGTIAAGVRGREATVAERQLLLFSRGPTEKMKAQLEVAKGEPLLPPRKPRPGLQEMVQERACVLRLVGSPSPEKVRAGLQSLESETAEHDARQVKVRTEHRGLRKTLRENEGHAPMVSPRRQPDLESPLVGLGRFERD